VEILGWALLALFILSVMYARWKWDRHTDLIEELRRKGGPMADCLDGLDADDPDAADAPTEQERPYLEELGPEAFARQRHVVARERHGV
jgi:hypothetical protein